MCSTRDKIEIPVQKQAPISRLSYIWLLLALTLVPLMVSGDSLWIDEMTTVQYAREHTPASWLNRLLDERGSESFMPLSMALAWVWGKVAGTSEWAMRSVNMFWAILTLLAFWFIGRRTGQYWLVLFMAIQPFFWMYVNEARPYALQIAAGSWLLLGLLDFIEGQGRGIFWAWSLTISGIVLCGSHMLGIVPFGLLLVTVLFLIWRKHWLVLRSAWLILVFGFLLIGLLGGYYAWRYSHGSSAAKLWSVGFGNVLYVLYEFAGFSGLGLPRDELRELMAGNHASAVAAAIRPYLSGLSILALLYTFIFAAGFRRLHRSFVWLAGLMAGGSLLLLLILASLAHFPFWGRHFAGAFPFFVMTVAFLFVDDSEPFRFRRLPVVLLISLSLLLLLSSLNLRFMPRYGKDAYRTAAGFARQAVTEGRTVWWVANPLLAEYYGLSLTKMPPSGSGRVVSISEGITKEQVATLPSADMIILSKPDIFDPQHLIQSVLKDGDYILAQQWPAFKVWERLKH